MSLNLNISNGKILRGCSSGISPIKLDTLYVYDNDSNSFMKIIVTDVSEEEAMGSDTFGTTVRSANTCGTGLAIGPDEPEDKDVSKVSDLQGEQIPGIDKPTQDST
ncbi:MAG TPA: hypothetical protein PL124_07900 [Candidatus Cloacimonadota bacterium]|nr:hypothetical protein [Candidatus Cloacimonadota bacterium]